MATATKQQVGKVVQVIGNVLDVEFESDDPAYSGTMTMAWSLDPVEGGTRVEVRAEDVPPGISAEDHAAGLASSLRNLADYLTG